jgi:hypothetical protein
LRCKRRYKKNERKNSHRIETKAEAEEIIDGLGEEVRNEKRKNQKRDSNEKIERTNKY